MTTQVHILNSSDSNPSQHARVTFKRQNQPDKVVLLAPGESKAWWINETDDVHVTEVFSPKPSA